MAETARVPESLCMLFETNVAANPPPLCEAAGHKVVENHTQTTETMASAQSTRLFYVSINLVQHSRPISS